jgi:hypothetical protein
MPLPDDRLSLAREDLTPEASFGRRRRLSSPRRAASRRRSLRRRNRPPDRRGELAGLAQKKIRSDARIANESRNSSRAGRASRHAHPQSVDGRRANGTSTRLIVPTAKASDLGGRVARHFHTDAFFNDHRSRPRHRSLPWVICADNGLSHLLLISDRAGLAKQGAAARICLRFIILAVSGRSAVEKSADNSKVSANPSKGLR